MRSPYTYFAIVAVLVGVVACSILQKKDSEQEVRTFLTSFQNNLNKSDSEILKQFDSQQSSEAILTAIRILQNKEHQYIQCHADFSQAQLVIREGDVDVVVPVKFNSINIEQEYKAESSISLKLKPKDGEYVISKLDGEVFYKSFADLKLDMEYYVERSQAFKVREPIFAQAQQLQQKFDSVIWYTTYNQKRYYYVVKGEWDSAYDGKRDGANYKMGLIDEVGTIIIPIEYDLIGTLGFVYPNLVELTKNGKSGYFDLMTNRVVIPVSYDMIIPYKQGATLAIVKSDTTFGWVSSNFEYAPGFPSATASQWVNNFEFIPSNLKFKGDSIYAFCEIPNEPHIGYGVLIPPSYLVKSGLFGDLIQGISTTPFPYGGWTEYMETRGTKLETISDKISAVMTTITSRYIEGREEFYTYSRVVFVDPQHDTVGVDDISSSEVHFKRIDSTLLELSYINSYDYMEGGYWDEYNMLNRAYFMLKENAKVERLSTHRNFSFTQFVKIDSTYLSGDYTVYLDGQEEKRNFLSVKTIEYIRAEILADYGFIFTDEQHQEYFKGYEWYNPRYESIEAFREDMTEIDRYNLDFLDNTLSLMQKPV